MSWANINVCLWGYAHVGVHPGRLLDHCVLSIAELPRGGQIGARKDVRRHLVSSLWSLAMLREWDHPLLMLLLLPIASAPAESPAGVPTKTQLAQFMLLAASAGRMHLVATIPDGTRKSALAVLRGALPLCCS